MKTLNFAIFGALLAISLTTQALAETTIPWTKAGCESVKGTWVTAHKSTDSGCDAAHCNGKNFCRSPQMMNFWSAVIWCKSIGRTLAGVEDACPNGLSSGNTCANLASVNGVRPWTSDPSPTDAQAMMCIVGSSIQMTTAHCPRGGYGSCCNALCK